MVALIGVCTTQGGGLNNIIEGRPLILEYTTTIIDDIIKHSQAPVRYMDKDVTGAVPYLLIISYTNYNHH